MARKIKTNDVIANPVVIETPNPLNDIVALEAVNMPDSTDLDGLVRYAAGRAKLTEFYLRRSAAHYWDMGKALVAVRERTKELNRINKDNKGWVKLRFPAFLEKFASDVGFSQTWCYNAIAIAEFFRTGEEIEEFSVTQSMRIAGVIKFPKTQAEKDAEAKEARELREKQEAEDAKKEEETQRSLAAKRVAGLEKALHPEPIDIPEPDEPDGIPEPSEPEDDQEPVETPIPVPDPAQEATKFAHEVNTVVEVIHDLYHKVVGIKSRKTIDMAKLEAAKKEIADLIKMVKKLPE